MMRLHVPDDIIVNNILSRLPVKSLQRFRCVCKSWYSIIGADYFCTLHRLHFNSINTHHRLVSLGFPISNPNNNNNSGVHSMYLSFYDKSVVALGCQLLELDIGKQYPISKLNGRFYQKIECSKIISSCHGVLCLLVRSSIATRDSAQRIYSIYLCNPFIGQSKLVISFRFDHKGLKYRDTDIKFGFGFAPQSNDYKVVLIRKELVEVYSLRTNTWATIQATPDSGIFNIIPDSTYINGVCHWLISEDTIMCFNFDSEEFGYIMPPKCDSPDADLELFVYKDMLAYLSFYKDVSGTGSMSWNVWGMKEYGVQDSWTPLIRGIGDVIPHNSEKIDVSSLNIGNTHQVLVSWYGIYGSYIILWAPLSNETKILKVRRDQRLVSCDQSLVSLEI